MANIAFDHDGTITEDPQAFFLMAALFKARGHKVYIVTMRYESEGDFDPIWKDVVEDIIFTGRQSKRSTVASRGIEIHIWIDDNPKTVDHNAIDVWGWVSAEGDIIIEDHGSNKPSSALITESVYQMKDFHIRVANGNHE